MMQITIITTFYSFLLVNNIASIIRNDITGRCLHIGFLENKHNETVYATSCTWNTAATTSHPDESLEIIPSDWKGEEIITKSSPGNHISSIRKVTTNSTDVCLATINNHPGVSQHCSNREAAFTLDLVQHKNFKGLLTSKSSIKIRNAAGKCLTVQPGQYLLKFKDCSPRQGLFQVWNICRQNKICDVDISWSPRQIMFPKNSSVIEGISGDTTAITYNPKNTETTVVNECKLGKTADTEKVITNEVLYTVQNAVRLYARQKHFIVNGISAFYTQDILLDTQHLLLTICKNEKVKCTLCTESGNNQNSSKKIVAWLINWMVECNDPSPESKVFLSRDVFQVPHYLFFPSQDSSSFEDLPLEEKYPLVISNLREYLIELEKTFSGLDVSGASVRQNVTEVDTDSGKRQNLDVHKQNHTETEEFTESGIGDNQYNETTTEITSVSEPTTNATQNYISIIDIRLPTG